jgi:hypothetical protein
MTVSNLSVTIDWATRPFPNTNVKAQFYQCLVNRALTGNCIGLQIFEPCPNAISRGVGSCLN